MTHQASVPYSTSARSLVGLDVDMANAFFGLTFLIFEAVRTAKIAGLGEVSLTDDLDADVAV